MSRSGGIAGSGSRRRGSRQGAGGWLGVQLWGNSCNGVVCGFLGLKRHNYWLAGRRAGGQARWLAGRGPTCPSLRAGTTL